MLVHAFHECNFLEHAVNCGLPFSCLHLFASAGETRRAAFPLEAPDLVKEAVECFLRLRLLLRDQLLVPLFSSGLLDRCLLDRCLLGRCLLGVLFRPFPDDVFDFLDGFPAVGVRALLKTAHLAPGILQPLLGATAIQRGVLAGNLVRELAEFLRRLLVLRRELVGLARLLKEFVHPLLELAVGRPAFVKTVL